MSRISFSNLILPNKPNYYLACPQNYCNLQPHATTTFYPADVKQVLAGWQKMLTQQPRVKLISSHPDDYHYQYVQYSRIFKFPDYIDMLLIPLMQDKTSIAIYSRSKYGFYDFAVNKNRVNYWLHLLSHYLNNRPL